MQNIRIENNALDRKERVESRLAEPGQTLANSTRIRFDSLKWAIPNGLSSFLCKSLQGEFGMRDFGAEVGSRDQETEERAKDIQIYKF